MTGKIPQAWFDAAQDAADATADHGMGPMPDHVDAAVKAVLPLMMLDLITYTSRDRLPYDKWTTEQVHEAIRAWARERGVDMGET